MTVIIMETPPRVLKDLERSSKLPKALCPSENIHMNFSYKHNLTSMFEYNDIVKHTCCSENVNIFNERKIHKI